MSSQALADAFAGQLEADLRSFPEQPYGTILHFDEGLMAVNKPAGLSTPGGDKAHPIGMYKIFRDVISGYSRVLHRLDVKTSGVLLVSLDPKVTELLTYAGWHRNVRKEYLCVVKGIWDTGKNGSLVNARLETGRKRTLVSKYGKSAKTRFTSIGFNYEYGLTLMRANLVHAGRTHQIRAHANHMGYPLLGDTLYGHSTKSVVEVPRTMLHAYSLVINNFAPKSIVIMAPVPDDFQMVVNKYFG